MDLWRLVAGLTMLWGICGEMKSLMTPNIGFEKHWRQRRILVMGSVHHFMYWEEIVDNYYTIGEAWLNVCTICLNEGREYIIMRGSYEGQRRKQLDQLAFIIKQPDTRPLGINYKGMAVSDDASIQRYFEDYLINPELATDEQYSYASRISPYLEIVANMLQETPDTNQTTIEVGQPEDIYLKDPPCLRVLSWKVTPAGLQLSSFWRSWDLYVALPTNLGGLQLLNELMAEWAEIPVGPLVCYSDGGHIYDHCWEML